MSDHRPFRYIHVADFSAVHYFPNLTAEHPEYPMHGHNYTIEVHFAGYELTGSGWGPGETDAPEQIDAFILRYLDRANLTVNMDFPTTPSSLAAYLHEVFSHQTPHRIEKTVLIVDGRNRYEFIPTPEEQP